MIGECCCWQSGPVPVRSELLGSDGNTAYHSHATLHPQAGDYRIYAAGVEHNHTVYNMPFIVKLFPSLPSANGSVLEVPSSTAKAGSNLVVTAGLRDAYANPCVAARNVRVSFHGKCVGGWIAEGVVKGEWRPCCAE